MFSLDPTQLSALDKLRPTLPGQWRRKPTKEELRRDHLFHLSAKGGRAFRAARETAQHLRRSLGHAEHTAVPDVPARMIHEPRSIHLAYGKAPDFC